MLFLNDVNLPRSMINVDQCPNLIDMLDQVGALTNYAGTTLAGKEYRRRSGLSDSVCDHRALMDGDFLNNAC